MSDLHPRVEQAKQILRDALDTLEELANTDPDVQVALAEGKLRRALAALTGEALPPEESLKPPG
jgi:hypothetical protein